LPICYLLYVDFGGLESFEAFPGVGCLVASIYFVSTAAAFQIVSYFS